MVSKRSDLEATRRGVLMRLEKERDELEFLQRCIASDEKWLAEIEAELSHG